MKPKTITISGAVAGEPNDTYQIVEAPNTLTITTSTPAPNPSPWGQPATKGDVAHLLIIMGLMFLLIITLHWGRSDPTA